ncbi:flagellar export chaperone FlgN [Colwelliaceae bacterium 6471]
MSNDVSLSNALQEQLSRLNELEKLLHTEKNVIGLRDSNKLLALSDEKEQLLNHVQQLDNLIATLQKSSDSQEQSEHANLIKQIQSTLQRCQQLNEQNGDVIQQNQIAVERIRHSLLENRGKSSLTYDNKGKANIGRGGLGIKA